MFVEAGEDFQQMAQDTRVLVTVSTYNEMPNLPPLVDAIHKHMPQATVLVVDDNSPDGTGDWAASRAATDPLMRHIGRPHKMGLGSAILAAMRSAIADDYMHLVNMDADWSHDPQAIPQLVRAMDQSGATPVDLAIGSRYLPGASIVGWPRRRYLISRAINHYARWMLKLNTLDCSSGFRCYRVATLKRLALDEIRATGYAFQEEILWHLRRVNARFVEVPITFRDREKGKSKISLSEAISAMNVITKLGMKK